jgi:hypothetical protein
MVIKALERTLAPFARPEKPQVFPRPATSFINNGLNTDMLEAIGRRRCRERRRFRKRGRWRRYVCFDWDFCDDLTQSGRANRCLESVSAHGFAALNDAAHIHGRSDAAVPI